MSYPHGYYLRYLDGCRCGDCAKAWRVYGKQTRHERLAGNPRWVSSKPVIEHVQRLMGEFGVSPHGVVISAGLHHNVWRNLHRGGRCHRDTAKAVLSVEGIADLRDEVLVDVQIALPVRDRLVERLGSTPAVADGAGVGREAIRAMRDRKRVRLELARALWRLEEHLGRMCTDGCGRTAWKGGERCWPCFKSRSRGRAPSGCGTAAGYGSHRRNGTSPCLACRRAHAQYEYGRRRAS